MNRIQLFLLALFSIMVSTNAQAYPAPLDDGFVHDFADIIPAAQEMRLESKVKGLEKGNTAQLAVITIKTLNGETPNDYATGIGEEWGVGQEGSDNGIILLISVKEKKIYIATGYGAEGVLPDATALSIITHSIEPFFKANPSNPPGGIEAGVDAIIQVVKGEAYDPPVNNDELTQTQIWTLIVILLILFFLVIVFGDGGSGGGSSHYSSSSSNFGSGSSGGGGGFGGGSFGGGGAGGGW